MSVDYVVGRTPVKIRVDDAISINGPWWTVWSIDEANDRVVLRNDKGEQQEWSLAVLTEACRNMSHGIRARIGHPVVWLPIPAGYVYYGKEKGYLPPVEGGYVKDESGRWIPKGGDSVPMAVKAIVGHADARS
ncbi:hypothetical protein [Symbiobacterium thermophilum]|uniref:Uncharacterized protein n=1 Tax=Symbiobacterium thermophilum TaxID=2734 RepID=A0A953I6Z5_SYMTR|nr:hypothetical protein [Symbiobacterium thermophilum]MBY6275403.1 hypothetical protein [Symbiobacterium thermophilum]